MPVLSTSTVFQDIYGPDVKWIVTISNNTLRSPAAESMNPPILPALSSSDIEETLKERFERRRLQIRAEQRGR